MYELIITGDWPQIKLHLMLFFTIVLVVWFGVAAACLIDMLSGVDAARSIGEKVHSHRLRETLQKVRDYIGVLLPFLFIDIIGSAFSFYSLPYAQMIIGVGAILIEGWSVFENKRRKKSHAAYIPTVAKEIVKCSRTKDAEALIEAIQKLAEKKES